MREHKTTCRWPATATYSTPPEARPADISRKWHGQFVSSTGRSRVPRELRGIDGLGCLRALRRRLRDARVVATAEGLSKAGAHGIGGIAALGVNLFANCGGVPSHRRRIGIRTKCNHTGGAGEWKYYADITNVPSIRVLTNSIAFADRYRAQDVVGQCLRKLMGGRPLSGAMGKTLPGLYTGRFMLL